MKIVLRFVFALALIVLAPNCSFGQAVTDLDPTTSCPTTSSTVLRVSAYAGSNAADVVDTNVAQVGEFRVMMGGVYTNNSSTITATAIRVTFDYRNFFPASQPGSTFRLEQSVAFDSGTNWGGFGAGEYLWSKTLSSTTIVEYYLSQSLTGRDFRIVGNYPTPTPAKQ